MSGCNRWAALVVVAGFGYFTVKSNNTAKKREFMRRQGQEMRDCNAANGEEGASSMPIRKYSNLKFDEGVPRGRKMY